MGQRVEKKPAGSKKGLIIAGIVVAVIIAAYLGLCAWVGASGKILPNVSIAGVDVSGMTAEQAQTAVEQALAEHGDQAAVTLTYEDWSGTIRGSELQTFGYNSGLAAWETGREHFLTQGIQFLGHLVGKSSQVDLDLGLEGINQQALTDLLDRAIQEVGGDVTAAAYEIQGEELVMTKGVTGMAVDRETTTEDVLRAFQQEVFPECFAQEEAAPVSASVTLTVSETPPEEPDFDAIHRELYTEAKSAEMDPETHEINDHVVGVDFDVNALKSAYEGAAEGETFTVPLTITQPTETKTSLESKLFKNLLGQATSKVGGTANRKTNVKLSAAACNGVILLPGEIFSYNNTTGSRTADKGYLPAPIYVGGKSQDDVGGGICQTSSTIYYAVLHTTLKVVERHDHQFAVGYVPDGMDATVFYGSLDFRFQNNTDYPIKIVTESYDSGGSRYLTVKIYGTNVDGRYAVPERVQYDWVQPTTVYQADSSVARGSLVLDTAQYSYIGRKAQTYRYVYEKNGTLVEKQDMGVSSYAMRPNVYYYNPLDGDPSTWVNGKPPQPETTPDPGTTNPGTIDPGTTAPEDPGTQTGGGTDPGTEDQTGGSESTGTASPDTSGENNSGETGGQEEQIAA